MNRNLVCLLLAMLVIASASAMDVIPLPNHLQTTAEQRLDELDEIVELWRMSDLEADYYLSSGAQGDTFAVHYHPATACSILYADALFYSSGNIDVYIWDYSADAEAMYPNGNAPLRGTSPVSPLGDILAGPINIDVGGTGTWEPLFDQSDLPGGGIWNPDADDFMVGFVKTQNDGLPQPYADDISSRGTTFTWFGGPWMSDLDYPWGAYGSTAPIVDIMQRVGVNYIGVEPPQILGMQQLPNTTNPRKPCTFRARVVDNSGVNRVWAKLVKNGSLPVTVELYDPDEDNVWEGTHSIWGELGDNFVYWIVAEDVEGNTTRNVNRRKSFEIVHVPLNPILVIDDGGDYIPNLTNLLATMGLDNTTVWDAEANKGYDTWLMEMDWHLVIVSGNGGDSIPTREWAAGDDPFSNYLIQGGNLLLIDQDYLAANGEPAQTSFGSGDFAFDFLGLAGASNDPMHDETQFYGMAGTLTEPFDTSPYTIPDLGNLREDVLVPRPDAQVLFEGTTDGLPHAICYDIPNHGKTIYLAFDATTVFEGGDEQQFATLIDGVIDFIGPVWLNLIPRDTYIVGNGGLVKYDVVLVNLSNTEFADVDFWTRLLTPNQTVWEPLWEDTLTITPWMEMISNDRVQAIPWYAPEGTYTFSMRAGEFYTPTFGDKFTFFKEHYGAMDESRPLRLEDFTGAVAADGPAETVASSDLPNNYELSAAYPNPFNPSTSLTLSLPEAAKVLVTVYNLTGQRVATLANGELNAGTHILTFDAQHLASGVYFVQAEIPGELNQLRKVMLTR
ncbi:T9SS type A sorting domain-containing protein [bacterium]|nr:T9SS type A sorting domain-containing protein [bacterium]